MSEAWTPREIEGFLSALRFACHSGLVSEALKLLRDPRAPERALGVAARAAASAGDEALLSALIPALKDELERSKSNPAEMASLLSDLAHSACRDSGAPCLAPLLPLLIQCPGVDVSCAVGRALRSPDRAALESLLALPQRAAALGETALFPAVYHRAERLPEIIPLCDPALLPDALFAAACLGRAESLRALIPFCDPAGRGFSALESACVKNHLACAEALLAAAAPPLDLARRFEALARKAGSWAAADLLLSFIQSRGLEAELARAPRLASTARL